MNKIVTHWIKWELNQGRTFRYFDLLYFADYKLRISEQQVVKSNYGYIERNPTIKLSQNILDTIWISETYRIFNWSVKSDARKMRLCENNKGKSIAWIHPSVL
jgi:hypothetical protein